MSLFSERSPFSPDSSHNSGSPEFSNDRPLYHWLDEVALERVKENLSGLFPDDFDAQQHTLNSYATFAHNFSEVEWNPDLIKLVWNSYKNWIIQIQATQPGPDGLVKVVVGGVGTSRDPAILALLNPHIQVTGYDAVPQMIEKSQETLTWKKLSVLIETLHELEPNLGGIVEPYYKAVSEHGYLLKRAGRSVELLAGVFNIAAKTPAPELLASMLTHLEKDLDQVLQQLQNEIAQNIANKIKLEVATHLSLSYPPESFDWAIDNATLQHLTRDEQKRAIAAKLAMIRPGGRYCFNLRLDNAPMRVDQFGNIVSLSENILGRVFMDNRLNPNAVKPSTVGWRYYTTNSMNEVNNLKKLIENGELLRRFGPAHLPSQPKFRVIGDTVNQAGNIDSPDFITLEVLRVA